MGRKRENAFVGDITDAQVSKNGPAAVLRLRDEGLEIKQIAECLNLTYGRVWHVIEVNRKIFGRQETLWRRWDARFGFENLKAEVMRMQSLSYTADKLNICPKALRRYMVARGMTSFPKKKRSAKGARKNFRPLKGEGTYGVAKEAFIINHILSEYSSEHKMRCRINRFTSLENFCKFYGISTSAIKQTFQKKGWSSAPLGLQKNSIFDLDRALKMYARSESVSWVAQSLKADEREVRRRLKSAGVLKSSKTIAKSQENTYLSMKLGRTLKRLGIRSKQISNFPDKERTIYLLRRVRMISWKRPDRVEYIEKFLKKFLLDEAFVALYCYYRKNASHPLLQPSIDHIVPTSRGGSGDISNLQFLSWIENKHKAAMNMEEWDNFQKMSGTTSRWYTRPIVKGHGACRRSVCCLRSYQDISLAILPRDKAQL